MCQINPYYGINIEKLEYLNHVAEKLGTRLRKIVAHNTGTGDFLGRIKHGSLKGTRIGKLTVNYKNAIEKNLGDVNQMKKAIFVTFISLQIYK